MTPPRRRGRRAIQICIAFIAAFFLGASALRADEQLLPVARITIYPGDQITEAMLDDRRVATPTGANVALATSKDSLIGKIARRTLLPGQPILTIAVDYQRVVTVGAQVKIVFVESGMTIIAYGVAQQAGAVGDIIRVRNQDSGLFVSGRVQPDGSVRVSEG